MLAGVYHQRAGGGEGDSRFQHGDGQVAGVATGGLNRLLAFSKSGNGLVASVSFRSAGEEAGRGRVRERGHRGHEGQGREDRQELHFEMGMDVM